MISNLHPVERPAYRLVHTGPDSLSDSELVSVVLDPGGVRPDTEKQAQAIALARDPGKAPRGRRRAVMAAALELGKRWAAMPEDSRPLLEEPARIWEHLHSIRAERKEHFIALYLDGRNRLIHQETVSVGTLNASLVHPREVFGPAVERRAAAIIVAHNHPSGELRPSPEDQEATRRLAQAGRILGVPLLDHVIVTASAHYSFRREGLL